MHRIRTTVDPASWIPTLQTQAGLPGLFLAGQNNGPPAMKRPAAQGIVWRGLKRSIGRKRRRADRFSTAPTLSRRDDRRSRHPRITEPIGMFTSKAESG